MAGSPPSTDDPRKAGQGLFAWPDRGKWQHWWRKGSIYWKPNTSGPFGISFWYTDRAEYPVFMGECQSRQMTWSLLQWRWSLLMDRGAWRRIQEEHLGVSHRNRPAVCAQLCRELSFLNIHIFNRLKRLLRHTRAALRHTCATVKGSVPLAKQVHQEKWGRFSCRTDACAVFAFITLSNRGTLCKTTQNVLNILKWAKEQLISFWWCSRFQRDFDLWSFKHQDQSKGVLFTFPL